MYLKGIVSLLGVHPVLIRGVLIWGKTVPPLTTITLPPLTLASQSSSAKAKALLLLRHTGRSDAGTNAGRWGRPSRGEQRREQQQQTVMGRRARHSARTGDGGGELRARKRQLQDAEREQRAAELTFFDDPSDKESGSEQASESEEEEEAQEVLALGGGDDSEEEDSEEEEEEEELDVDNDVDGFDAEGEKKKIMQMDGKWGKGRKNFYSADTAEFELESDEEVAKDEEEAALELQRKQADMMDAEDFGFDEEEEEGGDGESDEEEQEEQEPVDDEDLVGEQLADIATLADDGFGAAGAASVELVQRDFSKLSKKDKLQIVNQCVVFFARVYRG